MLSPKLNEWPTKMNWKVEHNEKLGIISVTYDGFIRAIDYFDSTIMGIELSNQKMIYHGLIDSRHAVTDATKYDLFKLPFKVYNSWGLDKSARIAVIEPIDQAAKDLNSFFVISCKKPRLAGPIFCQTQVGLEMVIEMI